MKHPHAELMIAYANDTSLEFEYRPTGGEEWYAIGDPAWLPETRYRIKPKEQKMLSIVGSDGVSRSYPEPVKDGLPLDSNYFVPVVGLQATTCEYVWTEHAFDELLLKRGLVHLIREAAHAHAKAMLGMD